MSFPAVTKITVSLDPEKSVRALIGAVVILVGLHSVFGVWVYFSPGDNSKFLYQMFNLGSEQNIPTHFSVSLWLAAAGLCFLLALDKVIEARSKWRWLGIATIALYISVDELVMIHERTVGPMRELFGASGAFYHAWIIPYGLAAAVVALIFLRFVLSLPRWVSLRIILAGFIYLCGAIGFEMVEGFILQPNGFGKGVVYRVSYTIEETLELIGTSLFVHSLIGMLALQNTPVESNSVSVPIREASK